MTPTTDTPHGVTLGAICPICALGRYVTKIVNVDTGNFKRGYSCVPFGTAWGRTDGRVDHEVPNG